MKQFICRLQPARIEMVTHPPSAAEASAVARHFSYLEKLIVERVVLVAWRTLNMDEGILGIVMFSAESDERAREIFRGGPTVADGVMKGELFPYGVALLARDWIGEP